MVFVGIRGQGGQDGGVHVGLVLGEHRLVAEVHQGLVGVVTEELLDVLGEADLVVQRFGVVGFVVVQLEQQLEGVVLEFLTTLGGLRFQAALVLVADVVAVHGLVADDEADDVGGVGELGAARPVHRQVEARVEQERLEQRRGHLAFERVVATVVVHDDACLALQVLALLRPAEGLVDLPGGAQRGEDGAVALGVHRLHERDVGEHRLLVRGDRVGDERDRADGALDGVEQRQAGEHPHRELLLVLGERAPRRDVVGHRHLLRQPEVADQPVPDLGVLLVGNAVPVDRGHPADELDRGAVGWTVGGFEHVPSISIVISMASED